MYMYVYICIYICIYIYTQSFMDQIQKKSKRNICKRNVFIVLFSFIVAIAFKEIIHFYPSNHSLR